MSKPHDTQQGISKIYAFCWKIQQGALGQSAAGVTYLTLCMSQNTFKKLILKSISPLKVAETLLSGSRKGEVGA